MKLKASLAALAAAFLWSAPAAAQQSMEERLLNLERRIQYLEKRVADQDKVIVEKERQIAKLTGKDRWFENVKVGGVIELDTVYESPYEGDGASNSEAGKVEIGIEARIHDWAAGEIVLLDEPGEDFDVDTAAITIGPPDGSWHFTGGRYAVPFGAFETGLISDPLTLELGEAAETALGFGFSAGGFEGSVFVFNGDSNRKGRDRIDSFGAALGWAMESDESGGGLNVSWISDIGDSNGLQDAIADSLGSNDVADRVPGVAASAMVSLGGFTLIGEYLAALDEFQAGEVAFLDKGAEPSSWMVEAAYGFKIGEKDATITLSYQGTDEALALELPKKRFLAGLSVDMFDGVSLALEWARDGDYGKEDGGTGKSADAVTAKIAAEF